MQPFIYFFNEQRSHLTNEEYGDPLVVGVVQLLSVVVPLATVALKENIYHASKLHTTCVTSQLLWYILNMIW